MILYSDSWRQKGTKDTRFHNQLSTFIEKREQELEKQAERDRLMALKNQNEEEYIRLLKNTKNERLITLLKQTEEYMTTLGATIRAEQAEAEEEKRRKAEEVKRQKRLQRQQAIANGEVVQGEDLEEDLKGSGMETQEAPKEYIAPSGENDVGEIMSSRKKYYQIAHAVKEKVTDTPPGLVAGKLRKYQLAGLEWLVSLYNNNLNGILADEMGLGKTVQTISLLAYLMEYKNNNGPFLIIVPMSTLHNNWEYEFDRWVPGCKKIVYDGDKERRKHIRETQLFSGNYNALLTTFEFAMRDKKYLKKIPWEYIIIDEAHRLKNPKCKLASELAQYHVRSRRVALTGTPLQNELPELWALLNFLHPTIFNSCENFERWFASPFANLGVGGDKEQHAAMTEEEKLLVIDRLHCMLRPFMLRREKREVETQLATKLEKVLRCELTPTQRILYQGLMTNQITMHNKMVQLRKVCNHPYLFHPYTRSVPGATNYVFDESLVRSCGKFMLLDQILPKLKATGHRVLIFNQMTRVMDVLEEYFNLRGYKFLRLDGHTSTQDRSQGLKDFNAPNSEYFIFMLSTKAGGLGLNLQSADTVILFDSDWNPQNDEQAMARAHRIGQKQQVIVLRLITTATVEEKILATAYNKLDAEAMVIQAGMFHNQYKEEESKKMLEKVMHTSREEFEGSTIDDDEVCRALARSQEELEIFLQMDKERKEKEVMMMQDEDKTMFPVWLVEWCRKGNRASESSQEMVDIDKETIFATEVDPEAPTFTIDGNGRIRRPRKDVQYSDNIDDRAFILSDSSDDEEKGMKNSNQDQSSRLLGVEDIGDGTGQESETESDGDGNFTSETDNNNKKTKTGKRDDKGDQGRNTQEREPWLPGTPTARRQSTVVVKLKNQILATVSLRNGGPVAIGHDVPMDARGFTQTSPPPPLPSTHQIFSHTHYFLPESFDCAFSSHRGRDKAAVSLLFSCSNCLKLTCVYLFSNRVTFKLKWVPFGSFQCLFPVAFNFNFSFKHGCDPNKFSLTSLDATSCSQQCNQLQQ